MERSGIEESSVGSKMGRALKGFDGAVGRGHCEDCHLSIWPQLNDEVPLMEDTLGDNRVSRGRAWPHGV